MPLTIALCDDESLQIQNLRRLIGRWSKDKPFAVEIVEYESAEQFLFEYSDNPCDLLLLDVEMRGLNGVELAKRLRSEGDMLPILFITGYSEHMSEGYDVGALHYLLKPVDEKKLFAVLDRYALGREKSREIILEVSDKTIHVAEDSIVYIEAFGRKTQVHLSDKTLLDCHMSLGVFEDFGFVRCHRSYLVNLRYVTGISRTEVLLDGGGEVPLSRRLYHSVNQAFIQYYTKH